MSHIQQAKDDFKFVIEQSLMLIRVRGDQVTTEDKLTLSLAKGMWHLSAAVEQLLDMEIGPEKLR